MKKPRVDRNERDAEAIERGRRLRIVTEDPAVIAYFAKRRDDLITKMVEAANDDERRTAAFEIRALEGLKTHMQQCVTLGDRALQTATRKD